MRNPGGYAVLTGPDGTQQADTFTCGHCQRIVHVRPLLAPEDTGGLCKVCMRLICKACVLAGTCTPWESLFAQMEARNRARRSYGI